MSLSDQFAAYLRAPNRTQHRGLIAALDAAGRAVEARSFQAWCEGADRHQVTDGAWLGTSITLGTSPPRGVAGDLWFDVCELVLMLHAGRAWLSTLPTARWQMIGFLSVSERGPRQVQVAPPYRALDPLRLATGDELASATELTAGEATLYAWWFGKGLPHLFDWQSAEEALPGRTMRELWRASAKEWTSTKLAADEAARIFVTPSTIRWDPAEVVDSELAVPEPRRGMIRGESTRDREIGCRTSVPVQTGLLQTISAWQFLAEEVRLLSLLDRRLFR